MKGGREGNAVGPVARTPPRAITSSTSELSSRFRASLHGAPSLTPSTRGVTRVCVYVWAEKYATRNHSWRLLLRGREGEERKRTRERLACRASEREAEGDNRTEREGNKRSRGGWQTERGVVGAGRCACNRKRGKRSRPKTRKPASNERHLTSVARARANRRPDFSGSH